ncbi:MAG: tripartite tricarboxylate transporter substrate binding protein, partial [Chloroflexota bacterium]|nr:tripartite tricarboxylate transporter substrate binding protein [Chloroflexota bacterium]
MNVNTRKLYLVLAMVLALVLNACAPAATPEPTKAPAAAAATKAPEPTKAPAEKYPTRPIRVVQTHAPGGWLDTNTRLIQPYVEKYLGVSLAIENMEGAGGRKARAYVYTQPPDGYTILVTALPTAQLGEFLYAGEYKTTNFSFISTYAPQDVQVIAVAANSPIKTYKDLVELSKTKVLKLGTAGTATPDHVVVILLKEYTGLQADAVPFATGADSIMATLGGKIDGLPIEATTLVGRSDLRPLISVAAQRLPILPDVPTLKEAGFTEFNLTSFMGFLAPPGLSEDKRKIFEDAVAKANADPEYVAKLKTAKGMPPLALRGAEFKKAVEAQNADIQKVLAILQA